MEPTPTSPTPLPASAPATRSRKRGGTTPTQSTDSVQLQRLQLHAVRYVIFVLDDPTKVATVDQFVTQAIARLLKQVERQGLEFPPKLLAELEAAGLMK